LVLPDFADAYSRTTASYRLTQLSGQIPESSQFWVPVNYPYLNELVSMPELRCIPTQFRLPPIYACVSYLSAMILLFLDLQGALCHSLLELKIPVNAIQSQKHLGICLKFAQKADVWSSPPSCSLLFSSRRMWDWRLWVYI
jgi:hypothetical protein